MVFKKNKIALFFFLAVFFAVGFLTGKIFQPAEKETKKEEEMLREKGNYQFISPLLDCNNYYGSLGPVKTKKIKEKLEIFSKNEVSKYRVKNISIFFRDLSNGSVLEINGGEKFTPASLLKVPIMISYFKKEESNPGFLAEKVVYKPVSDQEFVQKDFLPEVLLQDGAEYTLEEIIENMVVYSNNFSAVFLERLFGPELLKRVYLDLGLIVPGENSQTENYMTVKEYAAFFRILYNSSYLDRKMSEKALEILSRSKFTAGLVAGLPSGIKVAHKFGERGYGDIKQLHDCGVIYYPHNPYILCVMTRGENKAVLSEVIKNVSSAVYDEISK